MSPPDIGGSDRNLPRCFWGGLTICRHRPPCRRAGRICGKVALAARFFAHIILLQLPFRIKAPFEPVGSIDGLDSPGGHVKWTRVNISGVRTFTGN